MLEEAKSIVATLPGADQAAVESLARRLRVWLTVNGDHGRLALCLVGCEIELQMAEQVHAGH